MQAGEKGRDQRELHFFPEGTWVEATDAICGEGKNLGGGTVVGKRNPDTIHESGLLDTQAEISHRQLHEAQKRGQGWRLKATWKRAHRTYT